MLSIIKQFSLLMFSVCLIFLIAETNANAQVASGNTYQASAQNDDSLLDLLFTIKDIKVDETARTASRARATAIEKAETEAFDKLITKLTQPSDRDRLPEVSHAEKQALMRGIEIVAEQSSSRRYIATFNIAFEPTYVSEFFAQYKIPHVLSPGKGLMVIHGHERGLSSYLWEYDANIETARASVDWINRIRSYQFPAGRIFDRLNLTIDTVKSFDAATALKLAQKYDQASALIIHSKTVSDEDGNQEIIYRYFLTDGGEEAQGIIFAGNDTGNISDTDSVENLSSSTEVMLLSNMYREILEAIDSGWREQLLVDTSTGGVIEAVVPTLSAKQFSDVETRLSDLSLIKSHSVLSIEIPLSKMTFEYSGREDQLVVALKYGGLSLEPYGDGWLLRRVEDSLDFESGSKANLDADLASNVGKPITNK
ncbi:DUF2066 domain-containing protein [Kordiimonas sp. SCSIO 12610]|uniref:DUF2066 domain-containing protein n=1 Tax=Kordiimonas sp. SCSIO 12610 TaxID=2829597 RepID=UPI00210DBEB2|nr:DUF2066 domain-containing protein [Kordiimonas sp. SCSIO 12610]UTW53887.1 DUF2066 domain-containing protein [Kordiimonas sp. SCSIO 12610]